jgi:nucleoside-diphosphate-sugar epimerase
MSFHVVVGAGAPGVSTAGLLADSGERVRVITRSGSGPKHPLIETVAADAADPGRLTELAQGATTLFNCAAPAYHTWPAAFPPLNTALLTAAEHSGASYVMLGNLYGYGPVDGPITEDLPLAATGPKGRTRARMWEDAIAAHRADRVRVTEVRASQFIGPGAVSLFTLLVQPRVLAGDLAVVPADLDAPHSYSYVGDVAQALVAVSRDPRAWGRPWHAPSITISVRELAERLAEVAGAPAPRLAEMTDRELCLLGLTAPIWGEVPETHYMSDRAFIVDSSRAEHAFGLKPTPLEAVLSAVVREASVPA